MKTPCLVFSELKVQRVFTRKNEGLSRLYDRNFTPSSSRDGINLFWQLPQPIAFRVVTDACQIIWQYYLPDARFVAQAISPRKLKQCYVNNSTEGQRDQGGGADRTKTVCGVR